MTTLTWDRHRGHAYTYDVVDLGYNYRLDEIRSALGRVQLRRVAESNQQRDEYVRLYRELLAKQAPEIRVPFSQAHSKSSHYIFPVLLPTGVDKLAFMAKMKGQGIQTSWHYPPVHHFSIYEPDWLKRAYELPLTEETAAREVTLPLYPTMTKEQVGWVVAAVKQSLGDL
jgi:dTDP-4-amino-4,6-dideoxygalactose transaminase